MKIKREKLKLLILMGISYIIMVFPIWNTVPLHTSTDELGAVAGAAYFAGLDWSGGIVNSGYYGFGWFGLFFWLFKVTDNPILIYRVLIMVTTLLRIMCIPIAFFIGKRYLQIHSVKLLYLLSALMPFLYSSDVGTISNECMLELLFWVIILLTCKTIEERGKQKKFYAGLLILSSTYSLTIHTRALTPLIAVMVTLLVYGIAKRRLFLTGIIIGTGGIGYIVVQKLIRLYQQNVFMSSGGELKNATVSFVAGLNILDVKTWIVWGHMLLGMLSTQTLLNGGILVVCILSFFSYLCMLKKKKEACNVFYNTIFSITVLCMGATIFAFLLSGWFQGMLAVWGDSSQYSVSSYKGLVYVRYWNIYLPPFILCGLAFLQSLDYQKIFSLSMVIMAILYMGFIKWIIPIGEQNDSMCLSFFGFAGSEWDPEQLYYKVLLISITFFISFSLCIRKTAEKWGLIALIIFMSSQRITESLNYDASVKERMSAKIMASYQANLQLEQTGNHIGNIYVYEDSEGDLNWHLLSIAQFYFNHHKVQARLPDVLEADDVIITIQPCTEIEQLYDNVNCYVLDDNETWYTYLQLNSEE